MGGFGCGRGVEIFHQVFSGIIIMGISRYYWYFGYFLFFGGRETNEFEVLYPRVRYQKNIGHC